LNHSTFKFQLTDGRAHPTINCEEPREESFTLGIILGISTNRNWREIMKLRSVLLVAVAVAVLSSCARHQMMRGSVAMKVSPQEAHVCLGKNEVKVGDRVVAFRNECKPKPGLEASERGGVICGLQRLGGGTVVSLLNDHYSTVKFDKGVKFEEGTVVEKE
jgi:hypothetical protein